MKHICDVCGWEYDETLGYPEGGIAPAPAGKISPKILNVPCAR
jgi:rubredoxin-NAD+ reductase